MVDFPKPQRIGQMMGWTDNAAYKGFDRNRMALMQAFAGLGADPMNPTGGFTQGFANGAMLDQQYADEAAEKADATALKDKYSQWFIEQGQPQIAQGIADGIVEPGKAYWDFITPKAAKPPIEVGGVLVDPVTFQPVFDSRQPEKPPAAPSGYQWNPDGTQAFIPGGPADPANMGRTTEAQRRNQQLASVIQPELAAVEQNWSELANPGNQAGGMIPGFGNAVTSPGYQQASNSLATIAQSYLYSVSGAAATDAEVKKIVDSVTPKPFESQQSIDAKLARIRQMADAVIQAGGAGEQQQAPNGQTSTGVQWSFEP